MEIRIEIETTKRRRARVLFITFKWNVEIAKKEARNAWNTVVKEGETRVREK